MEVTPATRGLAPGAHRRGVALVLLSAVGFGLMAIFAKEAYRQGVGVLTLLALRFALAGVAFWAIAAARGPIALPARPVLLTGLGLGAFGYTLQSAGYFGALTRMDASLTALLLYTYPALVFLGALAIGRERADRRRVAALALASTGTVLVLAAGGAGGLDGLGLFLALGAASVYAVYILVADRVVGRLDPFLLSALVCTGAALALWGAGLATGSLHLRLPAAGWAWVGALALVSTVLPISAFLAGLPKVGPATAAIASTFEPIVTVTAAMLAFGERLAPLQVAGGALVLAAVVLLQAKVGASATPADAPVPASARALAHDPAGG
jgi:drug/metabolite transporter (DMT)-like permease